MTEMQTYKGIVSKRYIAINTSDLPVLTVDFSMEKMHGVIAEYEQVRIAEYWDFLCKKAVYGNWIEGFKKHTLEKWTSPTYFLTGLLKEMSGSSKTSGKTIESLRKLPFIQQQEKVRSVMPRSYKELRKCIKFIKPVLAPEFHEILDEIGSPRLFVEHLTNLVVQQNAPRYHSPRYLELLTLLWSRGYLLFPLNISMWAARFKWECFRNRRYAEHKVSVLDEVFGNGPHSKGKHSSHFKNGMHVFFAATDVASVADFSSELITAFEESYHAMNEAATEPETNKRYSESSRIITTAHLLRLHLASTFPELQLVPVRAPTRKQNQPGLRVSGEFLWITQKNSALIEWSRALKAYIAQLKTLRSGGQITRLNVLADFICALPNPPCTPKHVKRAEHVFDATLQSDSTLFEYLRKNSTPGQRNGVLYQARAFFDWYHDYLLSLGDPEAHDFLNPILSSDSFGRSRDSSGQTARSALPSYVLNEMKLVLVENDFALAKTLRHSKVNVVDRETNQTISTWFPGQAICLYFMLEAPTRSHQGRWLDSGELDCQSFDATKNSLVPNVNPRAIDGRMEGVLHLLTDAVRQEAWLGLWINTNKSANYGDKDVGYTIPYASEELASLLLMMRDWQLRYQPPFLAPIPYQPESQMKVDRKNILVNVPKVVPLFSHPTSTKRHPISYASLATLYTAVLEETQKRIVSKYGHEVHLVSKDEAGAVRWLVDLHSLRVSGLTAMIENGVPIEVVSQFVAGHATLVMTLHYLKYSPLKLKEFIAAAHAKAEENCDFVGSELFMENLEAFEPFLLGQAGAGKGPGLDALKEKTGLFEITADGICPGTSCSTGGPLDSTKLKHTAVTGGRRCGLCRYWMTGPAHLLGLSAPIQY